MKKITLFMLLITLITALYTNTFAQTITTIVGGGRGDGDPVSSAQLIGTKDIITYNDGSLLISDAADNRIRKISSSGIVTTIAGTGYKGYSGDGGMATDAKLNNPFGLASDAAGNIYIADVDNQRIRKINSAGIITTIAGNGTAGFIGNNGPATLARLNSPRSVAVDGAGNMYVGDYGNGCVRKINTSGIISVVAGVPSSSGVYNGDSIAATSAQLNVYWMSLGPDGSIYISTPLRIMKVNPSGIITTIAGGGPGYTGEGNPATAATVNFPSKVTIDVSGNLYFSDDRRTRKINTAGIISTIGGTGDYGSTGDGGPATAAALEGGNLTFDATGSIYITVGTNGVRKISPSGIISTYLARMVNTSVTTALNTALSSPIAIRHDLYGNMYICDAFNNLVRKVTSSGIVTVVAGTGVSGSSGDGGPATLATLNRPSDVVIDNSGNIYISDQFNSKIRKVTPSGIISTFAGGGFYSGTGPATAADVYNPRGLAIDNAGNIYVAEGGAHRIRKINTSGIITILAGTGTPGYSGDGGPATNATFYYPQDVSVDSSGNVYVADQGNNRIRKIASSGIITTIAGTGTAGNTGDGGPATAATIQLSSIEIDGGGNIFFSTGLSMRKINTSGIISTILNASGLPGYSGDGGPATAAKCNGTQGIEVDAAGTIYLADYGNNCIRRISCLPAVGDITGSSGFCAGSSVSLAAAYAGGTWASSNTAAATVSSAGVVTGVAGGTATISYTNTNSCGSLSATKGIVVFPTPDLGTISGASSLCTGTTTTLTGVSGGNWSSGNISVATVSSLGIVTGIATGNVTISYAAANTCGTSTLTKEISVGTFPPNVVISAPSSLCMGISASLSADYAGGVWGVNDPTVATVNTAGTLTALQAGTATVTYMVSNSCGSTYATANISVLPLPAVPSAITGISPLCAGRPLTLSNDVPGGLWSVSNALTATVGASDGILVGLSQGSAVLSYTILNECGAATVTGNVSVINAPLPVSGPAIVCVGNMITLTDAISGGVWSTGNTKATIDAAGMVTGVAAGAVTITYTGCGGYRTFLITVNTTPVAITGTTALCMGTSTVLNDATTGGTWSSANSGIATINPSTHVVTGITAGTATVSYVLTNGCYAVRNVTVSPAPAPLAALPNLCVGQTMSLTNAVPGGTWSSTVPTRATVTPDGVMTTLMNSTGATINYSIGSCVASSTFTVNTTPAPISGNTAVCEDGTVTLGNTVTGGVWSSNNSSIASVGSSGAVFGASSGTTTITYTTGSCYKTRVVTVSPTPDPISLPNLCVGQTMTLTNTVGGGTWSSTAPTRVTVTADGVVSTIAASTGATIKYGIGTCIAATTFTVNTTPAAIGGLTSVCEGAVVTLSNTIAGGTWTSDNSATATVGASGTVLGVASGITTITYTTGSCYKTRVVTVNTAPAPLSAVPALCVGGVATLSNSVAGGTWSSNNTSHATVINGVVSAVYGPTAIISYGIGSCIASTTVTINPTPAAITGPSSVCAGAVITLGNTLAGGTWSTTTGTLATVLNPSALSTGVRGTAAGTAAIYYTVGGCSKAKYVTVNNCNYKGSGEEEDVATVDNTINVRIYPNPATSRVVIEAPITVHVQVYATDGRLVMSERAAKELDVNSLSSGMYMIVVYDEQNNLLKRERLVKE